MWKRFLMTNKNPQSHQINVVDLTLAIIKEFVDAAIAYKDEVESLKRMEELSEIA